MRSRSIALPLFALLACGAPQTPDDPGGEDGRAPLGKADLSGSCADEGDELCGGPSLGTCWCDALCESYGDCCADYGPLCLGESEPDAITTDDLEPGDLIISEIMLNPSACTGGEWLELHNRLDVAVNVEGAQIEDRDEEGPVALPELIIPPHGYAAIALRAQGTWCGPESDRIDAWVDLYENGPDVDPRLSLLAEDGRGLDHPTRYSFNVPNRGVSWQRSEADGLRHGIWCDGQAEIGEHLGTPGAPGHACETCEQPAQGLSVGGEHACVLTEDERIFCWGRNQAGQLALGPRGRNAHATPMGSIQAAEMNWAAALDAGPTDTCRVVPAGVECTDAGGRFSAATWAPLQANPPLFVGRSQGCTAIDWQTYSCWGENPYEQLGRHVAVDGGRHTYLGRLRHVAIAEEFLCSQPSPNALRCAGRNHRGQIPDAPLHDGPASETIFPPRGLETFDARWEHGCLVDGHGAVHCWGAAESGQLGPDVSEDQSALASIPLPGPAVDVTTGFRHSCAALADGSVRCWGDDSHGQLGSASAGSSPEPIEVEGIEGHVVQIDAGMRHTCARTDAGVIWCWGENTFGQLGDGTYEARSQAVRVQWDCSWPTRLQ